MPGRKFDPLARTNERASARLAVHMSSAERDRIFRAAYVADFAVSWVARTLLNRWADIVLGAASDE